MHAKAGLIVVVQLISIVACFTPQLMTQTGTRLWVVREPDEIVEYDPGTFAIKETHKITPHVLTNPDSFAVSSKGQMLFSPEGDKLWFWDGRTAVFLDRGRKHSAVPDDGNRSVFDASPLCFLSASGQQLYWLANEFKKVKAADTEREFSVTALFRAWRTDLAGAGRTELAAFSFPPCECGTGVCSETCPEADFWIPDAGVNDFFIVTHWIPGQIGVTYQSSFLYRESEGKWSGRKVPQVMERILDGARGGAMIIHAVPDAGCCGWENESNDETLLTQGGKAAVLFDERQRYGNRNYDVSFYTTNAKLGPDASYVAMTVSSSAQPGADIRLSEEGKPDGVELARVRRALSELPAVEILRLQDSPSRSGLIPRATLVGWLNDREVLILEGGMLVSFNVASGTRRKSEIRVPAASRIYLR